MFKKNDNSFICCNCNKKVEKLKYTSRDHCNNCLYSIHVDIEPGDRLNDCLGLLVPINVIAKKDFYDIIYRCNKCDKIVVNKSAIDDNMDTILRIVKDYSISRIKF
ncbi:MAG: RNHCP domain-containing protein [Clostridia bacterium]